MDKRIAADAFDAGFAKGFESARRLRSQRVPSDVAIATEADKRDLWIDGFEWAYQGHASEGFDKGFESGWNL